jgi:hypothetical protein
VGTLPQRAQNLPAFQTHPLPPPRPRSAFPSLKRNLPWRFTGLRLPLPSKPQHHQPPRRLLRRA